MSTTLPYTQAGRFARIDIDEFGDKEKLLLVSLEGSEALSELFSFRIEAVAPIDDDFEPLAVLGVRASVTLGIGANGAEGQPRKIVGMIRSIRELYEDDQFVWYELDFTPLPWVTSQNQSFRIFQSKTLREIFKVLLRSMFTTTLSDEVLTRNYCVQYGESDLACATRLIEESGYYFFFPQEDDNVGRMMIRDDSWSAPYRDKELPDSIAFRPVRGALVLDPHVWKFTATRSLSASNVELVNPSYQAPTVSFNKQVSVPVNFELNRQFLPLGPARHKEITIRDYPAGSVKYFDWIEPSGGDENPTQFEADVHHTMEKFAVARAAELSLKFVQFDGASNSTRIVPGYPVELTGHRRANGEYLVTRVVHSLRLDPFSAGAEVAEAYENRFEAIPRLLPFRSPRRTPRPQIHGHQTAIVVGFDGTTQPPNEGEPVFTDSLGRVRVQFPWCENGCDSCWIRVAHAWAGQRWGSQFIPRIGNEVVVGFENGDPDCPLIYGSVYNANNRPAHDPIRFKRDSGVMNRTFNWDDEKELEYTGFSINDTPGKQMLHLRSARTLVHDAGESVVTVAPVSIDAYASKSSVTLVGGLLGIEIPGVQDFGIPTAIHATSKSGVWKSIHIQRPAIGPFVVNANFGSQLDIRAGFETRICSAAYHVYGSSKFFLMSSALPASIVRLYSLMGRAIGKIEGVGGHHLTSTNAYYRSVAAQHLFISGKLPSATRLGLAGSFFCALLSATQKLLAGFDPLETGSASRIASHALNGAFRLATGIVANLHLAESSLQKIALAKEILTAGTKLYQAALLADSKAMTLEQSRAILQSLPNAIEDAASLLAEMEANPMDEDNRSDAYFYTRRNHLIEVGELFNVQAKQALFNVDCLLANCASGLLATVGDNPLQSVTVAVDSDSFKVTAGNPATGGRLKISGEGVELAVGPSSKIVIDATGIKLSAPLITLEALKIVQDAPVVETHP